MVMSGASASIDSERQVSRLGAAYTLVPGTGMNIASRTRRGGGTKLDGHARDRSASAIRYSHLKIVIKSSARRTRLGRAALNLYLRKRAEWATAEEVKDSRSVTGSGDVCGNFAAASTCIKIDGSRTTCVEIVSRGGFPIRCG